MSLKVIGIDPGTARLGWAYLEYDKDNEILKSSLEFGVIETKAGENMPDRLLKIYTELGELLERFGPDVVGVEDLFFNKNVKTAITVAQARGVILMCARKSKCRVVEITPPQVKEAVVGYGRADKKQMQEMVRMLLGLQEIPRPDDAADAVAVAICAGQMDKLEQKLK